MGILKFVVRILTYATYPFLALSLLLLINVFGMGLAFIATFEIENRTTQPISVTPIGSVGDRAIRHPLPIKMVSWACINALQIGGFDLAPGQSVTIHYDMDDINFSEIVVDDQQGGRYQLITNPDPAANQYQPPAQNQFVIEDLSQLQPAAKAASDAADAAQGTSRVGVVSLLVMFVPWLALWLLTSIARHSFVNDSSKLSNTRDTTVQAAS